MMLGLIEIELIRVRRMAERADDNVLLLYLIDMAILEASRAARSSDKIRAKASNGGSGSAGLGVGR